MELGHGNAKASRHRLLMAGRNAKALCSPTPRILELRGAARVPVRRSLLAAALIASDCSQARGRQLELGSSSVWSARVRGARRQALGLYRATIVNMHTRE